MNEEKPNVDETIQKEEENLTSENKTEPEVVTESKDNLEKNVPKGKNPLIVILIILLLVGGLYFVYSALMEETEEEKTEEKEEKEEVSVDFEVSNLQTAFAVDEEGKPLFPTNQFVSENMEFYGTGRVEGVDEEVQLAVKWYYEDEAIGQASLTLEERDNDVWFSLTRPDEGWQLGEYEVGVYYDEKSLARTSFSVVADEDVSEKTFFYSGIGVYWQYPNDWMYEYLNAWSILFSGYEGTDAYYTTVNIQNVLTTAGGGDYEDLEAHYEDYKSQIEAVDGTVTEYIEGEIESFGTVFQYFTFTTSYEQEDQDMQQKVYLIERDEDVFHQISYTAPSDLYDEYFEVFEEMMASIKIIK